MNLATSPIPAQAFAVILVLYMAHTVLQNYRYRHRDRPPPSYPAFAMQTLLFCLAVHLADRGVFTRGLVSPIHIGLGLVLGHAIFAASLLVTHAIWRDAWDHFTDLGALWAFFVETPALSLRFLAVSFAEELIYRAAAQSLLIEAIGRPLIAIALTALAFSIVHKHFFQNAAVQSVEFFVFAVLLGILYYWTGSLVLVIVVHTVRNFESVYLDYLIKVDELQDEDKAFEALEGEYLRRPVRDP